MDRAHTKSNDFCLFVAPKKAGKVSKKGYNRNMSVRNLNGSHPAKKTPRSGSTKYPASWAETLRESDEDIAAGRIVPIDDVLKDLDEVIAGMEPSPALKP